MTRLPWRSTAMPMGRFSSLPSPPITPALLPSPLSSCTRPAPNSDTAISRSAGRITAPWLLELAAATLPRGAPDPMHCVVVVARDDQITIELSDGLGVDAGSVGDDTGRIVRKGYNAAVLV